MKNPICISKSSHCDLNLIGNYGNYLFYFHFNPCPLGTDNGLVVGTDKIIISLKINLYSTINKKDFNLYIKYLVQSIIQTSLPSLDWAISI